MKITQAPLVTLDGLHDPTLPALMSIPKTTAKMSKSGWLEWLERHDRFKFESPTGKFTAYKSSKNYWTAQRRVQGKLRHEYLGASGDLTYHLLDQTATKMNMPDSAYWRQKYPDPRAEQKLNVQSHKKNYETVNEASLQTLAEVEKLKQQLAEAKNAIANLERILYLETERADEYVADQLKAATILQEALKLKPNAGGAIKAKIKKALLLIDDL
jgi:hypothetical protein